MALDDSPMIRKLFNDFGGILGMEYNPIDRWSLLFRIRYSLMERSNKVMPSLTPCFRITVWNEVTIYSSQECKDKNRI